MPLATSAAGAATHLAMDTLNNSPSFFVPSSAGRGQTLLQGHGAVIVQDGGCQIGGKLTRQHRQDVKEPVADPPSLPADFSRSYNSSAVLPDGGYLIMGAKQCFVPDWTNLGAFTTRSPIVDTVAAPRSSRFQDHCPRKWRCPECDMAQWTITCRQLLTRTRYWMPAR